jgi:hypothetical protein
VEQNIESPDVYSEKVKAGKRTYFFDVKKTRGNDYYLAITESKKQSDGESSYYIRHKIFVYKEDLKDFAESVQSTTDYIMNELLPDYDFDQSWRYSNEPEEEGIN